MSVLSDDLRTLSYEAALYFYPLVFMDITRLQARSKPGVGPPNQFQHLRAFPSADFRAVVDPVSSNTMNEARRQPQPRIAALGFGAQNLVKDFIAGLFMLLEDQYGVGDVVDLGEASGTVEAVGLRITTSATCRGVLWYIRNGEIVRVGNKSQGWALVVIDVPVAHDTDLERARDGDAGGRRPCTPRRSGPPSCLAEPESLGVEHDHRARAWSCGWWCARPAPSSGGSAGNCGCGSRSGSSPRASAPRSPA